MSVKHDKDSLRRATLIGRHSASVVTPGSGVHIVVHFDLIVWASARDWSAKFDMGSQPLVSEASTAGKLPGPVFCRFTEVEVAVGGGSQDGCNRHGAATFANSARDRLPAVTAFELDESELVIPPAFAEQQAAFCKQIRETAPAPAHEDDNDGTTDDGSEDDEGTAAAGGAGLSGLAKLRASVAARQDERGERRHIARLRGEAVEKSSSNISKLATAVAASRASELVTLAPRALVAQAAPDGCGVLLWRPGMHHHFFLRTAEDREVLQMRTRGRPRDACAVKPSHGSMRGVVTSEDIAVHFLTLEGDVETFRLDRATPTGDCPCATLVHLVLPNPLHPAAAASSSAAAHDDCAATMSSAASATLSSPNNSLAAAAASIRSLGSPSAAAARRNQNHHHHRQPRNLTPASFCPLPAHTRMSVPDGVLLVQVLETAGAIFAVVVPLEEIDADNVTNNHSSGGSSSGGNSNAAKRVLGHVLPRRSAVYSEQEEALYAQSAATALTVFAEADQAHPRNYSAACAMHCAVVDVHAGTYCLAVLRRGSGLLDFHIFSEHCLLVALGLQERYIVAPPEKQQKKKEPAPLPSNDNDNNPGAGASDNENEEEEEDDDDQEDGNAFLLHYHSAALCAAFSARNAAPYTVHLLAAPVAQRNILVAHISRSAEETPRASPSGCSVAVCIPVFDARRNGWVVAASNASPPLAGAVHVPLLGPGDAFPPAPVCCALPRAAAMTVFPGSDALCLANSAQDAVASSDGSGGRWASFVSWSDLFHAAVFADMHRRGAAFTSVASARQAVSEAEEEDLKQQRPQQAAVAVVVAAAARYAHDIFAAARHHGVKSGGGAAEIRAAEPTLLELERWCSAEHQTLMNTVRDTIPTFAAEFAEQRKTFAAALKDAAVAAHEELFRAQGPVAVQCAVAQLDEAAALLNGMKRALGAARAEAEEALREAEAEREEEDKLIAKTLQDLAEKQQLQ